MERELDDERWLRFDTLAEVRQWFKEGGWKDDEAVSFDYGLYPEKLVKRWFNLTGCRLYVADAETANHIWARGVPK